MRIFLSLAVAIMTFTAMNAEAVQQRWPNWYIGLQGTVPYVEDVNLSNGSTGLGQVEFDTGWGVGASLGYTPGSPAPFLNAMRFELEAMYRENDLDTLGGASIADDVSSIAYMANLLFDIETDSKLVPYLGAGIGLADIELNSIALGVSDHDTVFAYQFMAGLGYTPRSMPDTVLNIGYRYFATQDPEFATSTGTRVEHDYRSHNIEAGARFRF